MKRVISAAWISLNLIFVIFFTSTTNAWAVGDFYMVENKVQADLENGLSRLLPRELFFVQTNAEIATRSERKLVEGETSGSQAEAAPIPVSPLPGFVPEAPEEVIRPAQSTRQIFHMVETPILTSIKVQVALDDSVAGSTLARAKLQVQSYLTSNFPNKSVLTFSQVPMLKPPKPPAVDPNELDEPAEVENPWLPLMKWAGMGVLALAGLWLILKRREEDQNGFSQSQLAGDRPAALPSPNKDSFSDEEQWEKLQRRAEKLAAPANQPASSLRRRLLERFINRAEAFRVYFSRLSDTSRVEIYAALRGPALDSLLEGLAIRKPPVEANGPTPDDDRLNQYEKEFEEFVQAKDWQDKQFFGFLSQLPDEQVMALASHENPMSVCIMLRFMKPHQSAAVLDALPTERRVEVLSMISQLPTTSFAEIAGIEKEVRTTVQRMPTHLFGTKKDDIDFWGTVLGESQYQDAILVDLEKTQPQIYPSLAKFKFRLEDIAQIPDGILQKVLAQADNEELCLAITTCSKEAATKILASLSARRSEMILGQLPGYKTAAKDLTMAARLTLTKRFREVLT